MALKPPYPFWASFAIAPLLLHAPISTAQVVPDGTLGAESSTVSFPAPGTTQIDGGARRGGNLFHSFSEFSVPAGATASFDSGADVSNIFSRVTGGNVSHIDGIVRANGVANLFFLNPNGIVFGSNAQLDIGGSFLGATAERLRFAGGATFGTGATGAPLLTANVPVGLQFGDNPGAISVGGPGVQLPSFFDAEAQQAFLNDPAGLRVESGRALALVGGSLAIAGGLLKAPAGRIELGGVGGSATVGLAFVGSGPTLDYEATGRFGNIRISGRSVLTASGEGGGAVRIRGEEIDISGGSNVFASTLGDRDGAEISVRADRLYLRRDASLFSNSFGEGNAGGVSLSARTIDLSDASVSSTTVAASTGDAGTVRFSADEIGLRDRSSASSGSLSEGNAGAVDFSARSIAIESSSVSSSASDAGAGGTVRLFANRIDLRGGSVVSSASNGTGNAGAIALAAGEITSETSIISSNAVGEGDAGTIRIVADEITSETSFISSISNGEGDAGAVTIVATGTVTFSGFGSASTDSGVLSGVRQNGRGNAGSVRVEAQTVELPRRHGLVLREFGRWHLA